MVNRFIWKAVPRVCGGDVESSVNNSIFPGSQSPETPGTITGQCSRGDMERLSKRKNIANRRLTKSTTSSVQSSTTTRVLIA